VFHAFNVEKNSPSLREVRMCVLLRQEVTSPASCKKNIRFLKRFYKALGDTEELPMKLKM
jgi:hypothetical protein